MVEALLLNSWNLIPFGLTERSNSMASQKTGAVAVEPRDVDTETKILDAAHAVFLRAGTAGARMQEIADEAGVNKALLHYYFRSKERLSEAVFRRAAGGLMPAVAAALGSEASLEDKVRTVVTM